LLDDLLHEIDESIFLADEKLSYAVEYDVSGGISRQGLSG